MPKFLDSHPLKGIPLETLKKLQNAPKDEFGVKHLNIIYSKEEDRCYCLLEAPSREAVERHHNKAGYTCNYILEVGTTADRDD